MVTCFAWCHKLSGLISSHDICLMFLTFRFIQCILIILKFYSILRMSHQRHRFVFLLFVFNVLMQPESQGFVQIYCVVSHSFSLRVERKQNDYFQLCTFPLHLSARILFFFFNSSCDLFKSMTYLFLLFSMCYSHYCIDFDEKLS